MNHADRELPLTPAWDDPPLPPREPSRPLQDGYLDPQPVMAPVNPERPFLEFRHD